MSAPEPPLLTQLFESVNVPGQVLFGAWALPAAILCELSGSQPLSPGHGGAVFGQSLCLPGDVTGGGCSVHPTAETPVARDTRPQGCDPTGGSSETCAHSLLTQTRRLVRGGLGLSVASEHSWA